MDYDKSTFARYGSVARPNIHLDYWSNTLNTILDLRQLTLGIGKLVNRCFADLEVYMPNDQS